MAAIHQLTAGFKQGDAVSNEAIVFRRIFRSWGYDSDIFCEPGRAQREVKRETRNPDDLPACAKEDDLVLLHLSTGASVNDLFARLNARKVILYHNITPARFLTLQSRAYAAQAPGLEQARRLAGVADLNLAVSTFNARELEEMGYREVKVLPLLLDLGALRAPPDETYRRQFDDGLINVLFVGRCASNKKLEDCLGAFHYFQKYVEPASRFIYAGSFGRADPYYCALLAILRDLRLHNVEIAGMIPQAQLNALYRSAHLFLSMSEHEGFCIPLLEAMVHDVPVLAFAAAAVPETMDGAGVLFTEKRFDLVAEMMGRLTRDAALRDSVIRGQRDRVARYEARNLAAELRELLMPLLVS